MSYRRTNDSSECIVHRERIFASGTFKNVWEGTYTEGPRHGQPCVAKEFKTGSVFEDHYFQEELAIVRHTQKILDDWHATSATNRHIYLNTPEIWQNVDEGTKCLVEPMIENFEKFNSNTGWVQTAGGVWSEAMQALSHFSYHNSGGQLLLCDLQGGVYRDG